MKVKVSVVAFLICITGFAQTIGVRTIPSQEKEPVLPTYDTTTVFMDFGKLIENPHYYDNQKILIAPYLNSASRPFNYYSGFYVKDSIEIASRADTVWIKKRKKVREGDFKIVIPKTNVYYAEYVDNDVVRNIDTYLQLSRESGFFTPHEQLEGKEFTVKCANCIDNTSGADYISLELIDEAGITVFFNHDHLFNESHPVMVTSFLEKYKSTYVGNSYHVGDFATDKRLYAGKEFGTEKYRILDTDIKCTEISFLKPAKADISSSHYFEGTQYDFTNPIIGLFFKDEKGREFCHELNISSHTYEVDNLVISSELAEGEQYDNSHWYYEFNLKHLIPSDEYYFTVEQRRLAEEKRIAEEQRQKAERKARLTKKYGKTYADLILQGKVRIGMTAEMCREAWGTPDDINRSSGSWGVHEQWCYDWGGYLYMENGKLTSIQN